LGECTVNQPALRSTLAKEWISYHDFPGGFDRTSEGRRHYGSSGGITTPQQMWCTPSITFVATTPSSTGSCADNCVSCGGPLRGGCHRPSAVGNGQEALTRNRPGASTACGASKSHPPLPEISFAEWLKFWRLHSMARHTLLLSAPSVSPYPAGARVGEQIGRRRSLLSRHGSQGAADRGESPLLPTWQPRNARHLQTGKHVMCRMSLAPLSIPPPSAFERCSWRRATGVTWSLSPLHQGLA
jgi:hypothetical protein